MRRLFVLICICMTGLSNLVYAAQDSLRSKMPPPIQESAREPLCKVDFRLFARFAEYWLETGADLPADLYEDEDNIINYFDLEVFVDEWLNYCPYDWALR